MYIMIWLIAIRVLASDNLDAWELNFRNKTLALQYFTVDDAILQIEGCHASAQPDHVHMNAEMQICGPSASEGLRSEKTHGLVLAMDGNSKRVGIHVGTGHLTSKKAFMYGRFEVTMRSHHSHEEW